MKEARLRIAYLIALWFGCGLAPIAPGTVGAIGALPVYLVARAHGPWGVLAAAAIVASVGAWASSVVAAHQRARDPQMIVVDEVAGVLVSLAAAPRGLAGVALAVALFRVFDILKPYPARAAERLPGGAGIVIDDLVAGGWGAAVMLALRYFAVLA
jgi:phosphatidylglycerophosphatase A